jgi:XTP/dITP diphosphohydrolase
LKKDKTKVVFFVTGNVHKFHEARNILSKHGIAAAMLNIEAVEIQDDNIKTIAKASATDAARKSGLPVFVEDAGLFIGTLNGFPGPYSNYAYRTLGTKGILKVMEKTNQREAFFHSIVAFCNPDEKTEPLCFEGRVDGKITLEERGIQGFGFDPIFQPLAEKGKTFAQMQTEEKNKHSHRAQALQKFAKWYKLHVKTK